MADNKTIKKSTPASVRGVLTLKDLQLEGATRPKPSDPAFAQYVRALQQNVRQGTVQTKGRSDVARSNKKPWRQKGTGRARAGTARSPLWRGGGVTFGPQARVRKHAMPKKTRRAVMNSLFWDFLENGRIICIDGSLDADKPSTARAWSLLNEAGVKKGDRVNVFVPVDDGMSQASLANLAKVDTLFFDQPNAFDLASARYWVIFRKDLETFRHMVSQWL